MKDQDHKMLTEAYSQVNENSAELLKGASKMESEDIPESSVQDDFNDFVDKHNLNYEKLAREVAQLLKDGYGKHSFIPFLTLLKKELKR